MRLKRSAVLITCSLLLVIFATACSSTTGSNSTGTTSTTTQQNNGTTQLDNQNKRDGQASAQITPTPTKASNESKKGNDQDDQGSSKNTVQPTPTPIVSAKNNSQNDSSSDDKNNDKADKSQNTSKPAVNNNSGQVATPTSTSGGTMYLTARSVTINGTTMNVLATGAGMTLYYRTSDPAPGSSCTGQCATTWPPLLNNNMSIITSQKLNGNLTVSQTANGSQVLYNGHPLYTYAGDNTVGQANGQGSGGVWYTIQVQPQKMHW
jgi:predicted lipoprotein with Yx(FWY)xxD motif